MPSVLIPLAQGCEELEAVTIIDLLRRAKINVTSASLDDQPVQCARGTVIIADTTLDKVLNSDFDCMVLPGGLPGADNLNNDPRIHQLITRLNDNNKLIGAICAAPKVLVTHGILDGKTATAFPTSLDALDTSKVQLNETALEIDNNIITSRGPGTAMDFALQLIELLKDKDTKNTVENSLKR